MRALVCALLLSACGSSPSTESPEAVEVAAAANPLTSLDVDHWIQGEAPATDRTVVVFWEVWCPHCVREVPKLDALLDSPGVGVIAVTRLTRGATEERVRAFLDEHDVKVPVAVGGHALAEQLEIQGVPFAAVFDGNDVVWKGHPARLDLASLPPR